MSEGETIQIRSGVDVISARMRVREVARAAGLSTADQARISLATSSLANLLELGARYSGEIVLDREGGNGAMRVHVVCLANCAIRLRGQQSLSPGAFKDIRWMVDDLTVEQLASNDLRVTLTKRVS